MTALTFVALARQAEAALENAKSYSQTTERGENWTRIAAVYADLARGAADRERRQVRAMTGASVVDQPRRLLCHYCVSDASEGDVIYEAMTIVNGTAVCHVHIDERAERGGPRC